MDKGTSYVISHEQQDINNNFIIILCSTLSLSLSLSPFLFPSTAAICCQPIYEICEMELTRKTNDKRWQSLQCQFSERPQNERIENGTQKKRQNNNTSRKFGCFHSFLLFGSFLISHSTWYLRYISSIFLSSLYLLLDNDFIVISAP